MFAITTAEIRWFMPGQPDPNLAAWLRGLNGTFEAQEQRDDLYLLFPGQEGLGIKLREGRMEFKKRLAVHPPFESEIMTGKPETWIKWSIQAGEKISPGDLQQSGPGHWITIRKSRLVQKYMVGSDGSLTKPPSAGYPERGIVAELSGLKVKGADWWTFGLECFGPAREVYSLLLSGIGHLTPEIPSGALSMKESAGYPGWISRISS